MSRPICRPARPGQPLRLLAAIVAIYLVATWGASGGEALQHVLTEYISFIILLGSLFLITGGVYVRGSLNGTPLANTGLMALGAVIVFLVTTWPY